MVGRLLIGAGIILMVYALLMGDANAHMTGVPHIHNLCHNHNGIYECH